MNKNFNSLLHLLIWATYLIPAVLYAEGTKELKPAENDKGNLLLLKSYSMFAQYGASPKEQLKLTIASLEEKIYFGLNNKNGTDARGSQNDQGVFVPDVPFRIVSPSGQIVYNSVIPDIGEKGNIATWDQAVAGPKQLGNPGGYDAFELTPAETGDYIIEFDPAARNIVRLNINLFDFTVAGPGNQIKTARLHSQGWQISTESYTNPFNGKVYPYDGNSAVYEVDFNGIQPFVFTINFNSKGTANTGNFFSDRQSQIGNHTYAEYEVFLNPPDETLYPVQKKEISLAAEVIKKDCKVSDFCLNFSTTSAGYLDAFVDLNMNGQYDEDNHEVRFSQYVSEPGTTCLQWDGKNSQGQLVPTGKFQVSANLGFGPIHLPLYDVEHNTKGYKINIVRPQGATPPVIFWDDTKITEGSVIDSKTNFTGCLSAAGGCHRWSDRGSIRDARFIERQETINTWWYSSMVNQTTVYSNTLNQKVSLSFHPSKLIDKDTTVCKGDSLNFYIYNDGYDHYNTAKYQYEWFFNNQLLPSVDRLQKKQINEAAEIIVKATDTSGACISYDTLRVRVVDKVVIESSVIQPPCSTKTGSIQVNMLAGPPNKQFYWQEFPANKTGTLQNLARGVYHLTAEDPAYPWCGASAVFNLRELNGIDIDTVNVKGTLCNTSQGQATVIMEAPQKVYEYSFDNGTFSPNATVTSLNAGDHRVTAREVSTGCTDDAPFFIPSPPLKISLDATPEICNNKKGRISIQSPSSPLNITWKDGNKSGETRNGLASGTYSFTAKDPANPFCLIDSFASITNTNYDLEADFDYKAVSDSGNKKLIQFANLSDTTFKSWWSLGDGSTSDHRDPLHSYWNDRSYEIMLQVTDSNGCRGSVKKSFSPFRLSSVECGINMPNAFSPNEEGLNNTIGILGYAPFVELKIFNRWGEIIFRTFDIEKRWDGFYRGVQVPVGVYPYILDWECPDGDGRTVRHQKVGDITLVR